MAPYSKEELEMYIVLDLVQNCFWDAKIRIL